MIGNICKKKLITGTSCLYKGQEAFTQVDFIFVMIAITSLVPRPLITANAVEGLVKLLRRITSSGCLEAWLIAPCMH